VAIIAVVFAVISAYYYLQIIKSMYFNEPEGEISIVAPMDMKLILSIFKRVASAIYITVQDSVLI